MFTGLIEEIGTIEKFIKNGADALITVCCKDVLDGTKLGDSIAINGVCQTVIKMTPNSFSAQVSAETIAVTNFASLKSGDMVNLERAMTLEKRFGGHIVNGHVDGLSKVVFVSKQKDFYNIKFSTSETIRKYIAKKGSVAVNGISLTVANLFSDSFELAIIPHTFENTTLKNLKSGDFVNIEVDILAKYVENFLSTNNNRELNENFLKENGFF